jgi:hypothetical protein
MPSVAERDGVCMAAKLLLAAAIRIDTATIRTKPPDKIRPV